MIIYVCSPYGGNHNNFLKAKKLCKRIVEMGHTPIASHVMMHGILHDNIDEERAIGLKAGLAMVSVCDEIWVFGKKSTDGMIGEIKRAIELNIPVKLMNEKFKEEL